MAPYRLLCSPLSTALTLTTTGSSISLRADLGPSSYCHQKCTLLLSYTREYIENGLIFTQKWRMLIWDLAKQQVVKVLSAHTRAGRAALLTHSTSFSDECQASGQDPQPPKALQTTRGMDTPCPAVIFTEMRTNFSWINTHRSNTSGLCYIHIKL